VMMFFPSLTLFKSTAKSVSWTEQSALTHAQYCLLCLWNVVHFNVFSYIWDMMCLSVAEEGKQKSNIILH
jgi:hypothetical protein